MFYKRVKELFYDIVLYFYTSFYIENRQGLFCTKIFGLYENWKSIFYSSVIKYPQKSICIFLQNVNLGIKIYN